MKKENAVDGGENAEDVKPGVGEGAETAAEGPEEDNGGDQREAERERERSPSKGRDVKEKPADTPKPAKDRDAKDKDRSRSRSRGRRASDRKRSRSRDRYRLSDRSAPNGHRLSHFRTLGV